MGMILRNKINIIRKYFIFILFSYNLSPSEVLIRPINGDLLNYTHIPFEWIQFPDAIGYNLLLSDSSEFNDILLDIYSENLMYIDKISCDWSSVYHWKIQPVYIDGPGQWSEASSFSIGEFEFDLSADIYSDQLSQHEYTFFGDWNGYRSAVLDLEGNEIWNSGNYGFMMNHISEYGQIFGCSQIGFPNNTGIEINYDEEVVWSAGEYIDQHEFKQISNGNYMGFNGSTELGPIPFGSWTTNFQSMGFQADGVTNEYPFSGSRLMEFDSETGEQIWSWNPHDYFSKLETDLYGGTWWHSLTWGSHDWTHSNAFYFEEQESAIYISHRHLSRISKIAYPSGEIIWNMGLPPSLGTGDDNICSDLEFSFQHHITRLSNGDLLFFDNGNLDQSAFGQSEPTSRALRVRVIDDSYCEVVWSHELPPHQFSSGMGSVQLLDNGNYFINSPDGSVLEVSPSGEILWEINLGMSWPSGSGYRAFRVPSIHPDLFSIISSNYKLSDFSDTTASAIEISNLSNEIEFNVFNHSGYRQPYRYELTNILGELFGEEMGTIEIEPYSSHTLSFETLVEDFDHSIINLNLYPVYHSYAFKSIDYNIVRVYFDIVIGDVNQDGALDVIDVILILGFILGTSSPADIDFLISDVNQDGNLDILDVVSLVNQILE